MQSSLETLSTLERRLKVAVPMDSIKTAVDTRLKQLQRSVKMAGFRPGKVPFGVVSRMHGPQVRQEVLGETVERSFGEAVREKSLRVAGLPTIETNTRDLDAAEFEFTATFEVFPDVELGDIAAIAIERPQVNVGDAEVDRTIDVLRKQRTRYDPVEREARDGDAVVISYVGTIDGVPFDGGKAEGQSVLLGQGSLLPDFEAALRGMKAAESRGFDLTFPADYHGTEVAGKVAHFDVTVLLVQEAVVPALDADFAKSLGIEDGDLDKMRADVRQNLEREVRRRTQARVKDQVLKGLLETSKLEVPKALIDQEIERLGAGMAENLRQRGMGDQAANMPRDAFEPEARRRVTIGLVLADVVRKHDIQATPEQVKAMIDDYAQSYEKPDEVVRWYYQSGERLREVESVVIENNVVEWVLGRAAVKDAPMPFDDLMGAQR
ncbi:MAG: trigger factor [Burkholderiales bacterium]|jgi:trigger factor|nr:trigger factor [Burkholderiales bacterium]